MFKELKWRLAFSAARDCQKTTRTSSLVEFRALMVIACSLLAGISASAVGTWKPLAHQPPGSVELMILLPDGTVMAANQGGSIGKAWYLLTPDNQGSYINGTWTTLASMHDSRLYYSSQVLLDGRVLVAGGEYGSGTNSAEIYDPKSDTWTRTPPPPAGQRLFFDSISKKLPNGDVLIAPVEPSTPGGTVIYVVASNLWINGPKLFRGSYQDEASWVKLPDDSILTIDPFGVNSERYIPSQSKWVNDGVLPVNLYNSIGELGAGFLLADGRAFFLGGTPRTAIYTPSGNANPGTWTQGPDIPMGHGVSDAAGAMMVNGKILCAVGSSSNFNAPTWFYEYDPVANAFTQTSGPTDTTDSVPPYYTMMLDLPDGRVLYSHFGKQLYVYEPDGSPLASGKPVITGITLNTNNSYHLTGTLLNGISEGAAYGDDAQMDSNYPLVRLTDSLNHVYYARTYNWSSTSVMTGNTPQSTEFVLPAGLPSGLYSLVVVANGISSDPVTFATGAVLITAHPQSISVYEGDSTTLTVGAGGAPPIFYQWNFNGNPIPNATNSTLVLSNVSPAQAGTYSAIVSNLLATLTSSNAAVTVIPTVPLPLALNATQLVWTTSGDGRWHGLTNVSHDGVAAGQSAPLTNNQVSKLSTTVTGPGTLSFWWKVSSEAGGDVLSYSVNSNQQVAISGEVDWQLQTVYLGSGSQTVQWVYSKGASGSSGLDSGWVDQVSYVAGPTAALVTTQPADQYVLLGDPATFNVSGGGTPSLKYQWQFNNVPIAGATNAALSLAQSFQTNSGAYSVIVSNDYGKITSSNAYLVILQVAGGGNNDFGQSALAGGTTNAVAIAAGGFHSVALRANGTVFAWGDDYDGQCDVPSDLTNAIAVDGGGYHSIAIRDDGTVTAWGADYYGQIDIPAGLSGVVAVAAGGWHNLALRTNGTVAAWGDNSSGQCDVPKGLSSVVAVAAGGQHSLALRDDGMVVAWGSNLAADGGYGGEAAVPLDLAGVQAIAAGDFHSLALRFDGSIVGWGDNASGQVTIPDNVSNAVAIAAGGAHSVAINQSGTVLGWGDNLYNQNTLGSYQATASAVAAGSYHTLVLLRPAPAAPMISAPVLQGKVFQVSVQTVRGKTYVLESTSTLASGAWIFVTAVSGNGGARVLTDADASSQPKFYRVRQQ